MIDLEAYFRRTGYAGGREPTRATLDGVLAAHVRSIPFENLDVLLGVPILLEPAALEAKLVHARRGGYCFEQNGLLLEVLRALGFDARPLSARVRYQQPRSASPARTHLFVRVELEESWLADVGVGSMSLGSALRLADTEEQVTVSEPRRILRENGLLYHQVRLGADWQDVYEFTLEEMPPIDRVVANWYTSTHPGSHFKNRLLVGRATEAGGRVGILNRELTLRDGRGGVERRTLASQDELLVALREHFGIELPAGTRVTWLGADWP